MSTPVEELLRGLPERNAPADSWDRVLSRTRRLRFARRFRAVVPTLVLAAAVAGVALAVLQPTEDLSHEPTGQADLVSVTVPPAPVAPEVRRLRARSQELERMLRGLPPGAQVVRADTALAATAIEDRIASVDYRLSRSAGRRTRESGDLWRERVELMRELLRVRYAEAGVVAF
jgi:hypothetical protein